MALNNPFALRFDGVDDYAITGVPSVALVDSFDIDIFFTADSFESGLDVSNRLLNALRSGGDNLGSRWIVGAESGHLAAWVYDTSGTGRMVVGSKLTTKHVYHCRAVYTGASLNLYLDGVLDVTIPHKITADTWGAVRLGIYDASKPDPRRWHGCIDEVRFFSVVRNDTLAETQRYRYLSGTEPGLLALYRMDKGTGNTLIDSSINTNHGTIYGATWADGLVDLHLPGEVPISATLRGSASMGVGRVNRIRGLSATLQGAATSTGGTPIRIRGLSANLQGAGTTNVRMNLIAALKAHLQGKATLKSNILVLFVPEGVYVIDADEIFAKDQPSRGQTVVNHVEVWVNPLKPVEAAEEVYRSKDPIAIPAGTTKTITIHFDDEPVTEPAVALEEAGANLSIVDTKYYAWGADVKIRNTGSGAQTCRIVATGKPLKVQGREVIVKRDEVSIKENGLKKYTFDNPFVQDRATAELIADKLLSFANAKRDIVIEWRGDPALELADVTMIPEYQRRDIDQRGIFYVTKQELEFDGGLRARLEGRKM